MSNRDYLSLVKEMGNFTALLVESRDIQTFLDRMVQIVASHLESDVCSVYLFDNDSQLLILKATVGLNAESINQIKLKLGEGLVGTCLKEFRPIRVEKASQHPLYKYFPNSDEDLYESFLAIPIYHGIEKIGVMVVQRKEVNYFHEEDVEALQAIGSQLAGVIENIKVLFEVENTPTTSKTNHKKTEHRLIHGKVAAPGYANGQAFIFDSHKPLNQIKFNGAVKKLTLMDFEKAVDKTVQQIKNIELQVQQDIPEAASMIFSAHLLMLKDKKFLGQMTEQIRENVSPQQAVINIASKYVTLFSQSKSNIIKEKANDVEDLAHRLLRNLIGENQADSSSIEGKIIISKILYPSDIVKLVCENAAGVILVGGGLTTHVSILSRSLNIPVIIVDDLGLLELSGKTNILLDATIGNTYLNPTDEIVDKFKNRHQTERLINEISEEIDPDSSMKDGESIHLLANINLLSEVDTAKRLKAEGIGLYRSEFPFIIRPVFPSEEEQVAIYRKLMYKMVDAPVTIRTLDIGGEKVHSYYDQITEPNPELGLRSIRFTLRHPDILETQLRAILKAGAYLKNLRIMFPLISSIDEFNKVKNILSDCQNELAQKDEPFHGSPKVGIMVELPAIVEIIDDFALHADFFSIGTNDFIQYTLGVDRGNDWVSSYYCPHHPAILRNLSKVARAANLAQKPVTVCGEMAHEPRYIAFLIGIGIRQFSVDPQQLIYLRKILKHITVEECDSFSQMVLNESSIDVIEHHFNQFASTYKLI